tara:strand:- start:674 stop:865 length:192 start_codon:yes stop_codon:yes gene_type:complete
MENSAECFRCGWCGAPVEVDGTPIPVEVANDMRVDWDTAKPVNGLCCEQQQLINHYCVLEEMG